VTTFGLQFDSTSTANAGHLPWTPRLVALYANGRYAHTPYTVGRGHVWIDVIGNAAAKAYWLDRETGDASAADVPGHLDARKPLGGGGVYCNQASLPGVISAASGRPMGLWLATLDGSIPTAASLKLPSNVRLLAVQAYPASMVGLNVDVSVVVDSAYWIAHAA
jgi:hypothetical protein